MKIFISYRRSDSLDVTGRIYEHLTEAFGADSVFKDVYSIEPGQDFREAITAALEECDFMLTVIGDEWLTADDDHGNPRIVSQDDSVHIELQTALENGTVVIPILVDGVQVPTPDQLPESLKELSFRNAHPVRPDPDFISDMQRLVSHLERTGGTTKLGRRSVLALICAAGIGAIALPAVYFLSRPVRIAIGMKEWIGYTPFGVAKEMKLFPKDIDVVFEDVESAKEIHSYLENGHIQIGFMTIPDHVNVTFINYKSKFSDPNRPVVVFKIDTSRGADGIVARPGVNKIEDLAGKKYLIQLNDVSEFMLRRYCAVSGDISYNELRAGAVDETPEDATNIFKNDESFAAAGTYEPFMSRITDPHVPGAKVILDSGHPSVEGLIVDIVVAKQSFVEQNQQALRSLMIGWFRAVRLLNNANVSKADHDTAVGIASKFNSSPGGQEEWCADDWTAYKPIPESEYRQKVAGLSGKAGSVAPGPYTYWPDLEENKVFFKLNSSTSGATSKFHDAFDEWKRFLELAGSLNPKFFDGTSTVLGLKPEDIA